jgi:hypothetical protein
MEEYTNEPQMGLTFEKVWAMSQETYRQFKEQQKETAAQFKEVTQQQKEMAQQFREQQQENDRLFKEQQQENDRLFKEQLKEIAEQFKEQQQENDRLFKEQQKEQQKEAAERKKELDRQFKQTDSKISKLGNRLGDLVEHIVTPNLLEKFESLNFNFGKMSTNVCFKDSKGQVLAEVDALLENGDTTLAIEIKTKLTIVDVTDHIDRMDKLRKYADEHNDKRDLIGAAAGAIVPHGVKKFALSCGFYVIEQSGDMLKIDVPPDFVLRKWRSPASAAE